MQSSVFQRRWELNFPNDDINRYKNGKRRSIRQIMLRCGGLFNVEDIDGSREKLYVRVRALTRTRAGPAVRACQSLVVCGRVVVRAQTLAQPEEGGDDDVFALEQEWFSASASAMSGSLRRALSGNSEQGGGEPGGQDSARAYSPDASELSVEDELGLMRSCASRQPGLSNARSAPRATAG